MSHPPPSRKRPYHETDSPAPPAPPSQTYPPLLTWAHSIALATSTLLKSWRSAPPPSAPPPRKRHRSSEIPGSFPVVSSSPPVLSHQLYPPPSTPPHIPPSTPKPASFSPATPPSSSSALVLPPPPPSALVLSPPSTQHAPPLAPSSTHKYFETLRRERLIRGIRRHKLCAPRPPSTPSKHSSTTQQRSPLSGALLPIQVGGGSVFSQPLARFPDATSHPLGQASLAARAFQIDNHAWLHNQFVARNNNHPQAHDPPAYAFAWYYAKPPIELPENEPSAAVYAQTYLRIIEKRQHQQAEIDRLRRLEEESRLAQAKAKEAREAKRREEELRRRPQPLDDAARARVQWAWKQRDPTLVLADNHRISISVHDALTLRPGAWLNDNIIDLYLAMVSARSTPGSPSVFAFSTHFFSRLQDSGYSSVRRWAKRKGIDVTAVDYIFVPINRHNTHWCLALINNKTRSFDFYDSMNGAGSHALTLLADYMHNQTLELHPNTTPASDSYSFRDRVPCPQQENGYDCGVFVCKMVEVLARNGNLAEFSQRDMPELRHRMLYEILTNKLLD